MNIKENIQEILRELSTNAKNINNQDLEILMDKILTSRRIFIAGNGRSGLFIRSFANRLMHLGFTVGVIGDVTTPSANQEDLLIICSGSGETDSLVSLSNKAKKLGVNIALFTMSQESTIGKLADHIINIPGQSPKLSNQNDAIQSSQPMGTSFEQLALLTFDSLVMGLMDKLNLSQEEMFGRHANLE